jgi:hypothetical protein
MRDKNGLGLGQGGDLYIYRDIENVIEKHSLGVVGIFRLFIDKLCQPYKRNINYHLD